MEFRPRALASRAGIATAGIPQSACGGIHIDPCLRTGAAFAGRSSAVRCTTALLSKFGVLNRRTP